MADMQDTTCSSSSSPPETDDISLFLHQILLRSSPSSSSLPPLMTQNYRGKQMPSFFPPSHLIPELQHRSHARPERISEAEPSNPSSGFYFSSSGGYFPAGATNLSTSSVGAIDNDPDDYDCESEEGYEVLMEDAQAKPAPPRNPAKRSRAAEVHNMSEKRRRSRINEKMKALQNLIPNSNKTDKASMLDEAIEYLKQLQLQVQMLTMRNGLSLYPTCIPGVLQPNQLFQMRMCSAEGNETLNISMAGTLPVNQCTIPNSPPVDTMSNVINSETLFGQKSSIQAQCGSFHPHKSSKEICRDDLLPHQQMNVDRSGTNSLEFQVGAKATALHPLGTQGSHLKENTLEACISGRDQSERVQITTLECKGLDGVHPTRSGGSDDDIKSKRLDF